MDFFFACMFCFVVSYTMATNVDGCVRTVGGNSKGKCCVFPFFYNGTEYKKCIDVYDNGLLCATTSNLTADKEWGFCTGECPLNNVTYRGYDLSGGPVESWKKCSDGCWKDVDCWGWSYNKSSKWCDKRESTSVQQFENNVISGPKECGGEGIRNLTELQKAKYECIFGAGSRWGAGRWMGEQKESDCIESCANWKNRINGKLVGVTVYSNTSKKGCWCESKSMGDMSLSYPEYKSCDLIPRGQCPLIDVEYTSHATAFHNVSSWQLCVGICQHETGCYKWTYYTENFRAEERRTICNLFGQTRHRYVQKQSDVISGPKWCNGVCPLYDTYYAAHQVNTIKSVDTWSACSDHCRRNNKCYAWSYFTEKYGRESERKDCDLLDSTYKQKQKTFKHVISGPKSCGGVCPLNNVSYTDVGNLTVHEDVDSWQACSEHCSSNAECYAWSYISEKFPNPSSRKLCSLKSKYWDRSGREMPYAISGRKACRDRCSLPAPTGKCRFIVAKYYYDGTSSTCKPFWVGGCYLHDNRFDTEAECMIACGDPLTTPATPTGAASAETGLHVCLIAVLMVAVAWCSGE